MKISPITNYSLGNTKFEGRKDKKINEISDYQEMPRVSNSALRNAIKSLVLVPIVAGSMYSCSPDVEIYDSCKSTIIINRPEKPDVPPVGKDTLYYGHIYKLPETKAPIKNINGDTVSLVKIPEAVSYIPASLKDNFVQPVLEELISTLGISTKGLKPSEGENKASVSGLPLQLVYSNPNRKTVTAVKFDGFRSSDRSFAYNSVEYNQNSSVKSSTHYDITYVDDKSLYVEKYDNFAPQNGSSVDYIKLNGNKIERYTNVGGNNFELKNTYSRGSGLQSVLIDNETSSSEISDIKVISSKL